MNISLTIITKPSSIYFTKDGLKRKVINYIYSPIIAAVMIISVVEHIKHRKEHHRKNPYHYL